MADTTYGPLVYRKQGGNEMVVASGGKITVETGGMIAADGGTQAATIADVTVTATYTDDNAAIETAINAIIAALVGAGIVASA